MCNLYRSPKQDRLLAEFAKAKSPPSWREWREWREIIAPLQLGPYIKQDWRVEVGQWGMIPPSSKTRRPMTTAGKPMSTNNARRETVAKAWTFGMAWRAGRRCLIPAEWFQEPYWGPNDAPFAKSIAWHFRRADGGPWALGGLWDDWTDRDTGEIVPSYTMLTQNCDDHPVLRLMHRPEKNKATGQSLPMSQQDKRTVVPIEREDWETWLHGTLAEAEALIQAPSPASLDHGPADPTMRMVLPA